MKRGLLLVAMVVLTLAVANAQCTPDPQYTSPGFYPDSATGFALAPIGLPYDQLVTNVVPEDTTTTVGGFPFTLTYDSMIVTSITGLPPGFSYSCYDAQNVISLPDGCAFEGNTVGCISIIGTPNAGDEGVYDLNISIDTYLEGGLSPATSYDIDYYSIFVAFFDTFPPPPTGIAEYTKSRFKLHPNPVTSSFTLAGLESLDISSVSISNTEGKVLNSFSGIHASTLTMNVADLEDGIYFVRIAHGSSLDVLRFIKK